ncbi:MAG TPA: SMP-30/gluconolactonase/LRE family protein [Candidatus Sulfopaludibacter sp.]|jgi:gluconolactonase|nr:SMP-30/gluconolactonase/LRE family protein [Candidatus Sulfopaludibacter sp.]
MIRLCSTVVILAVLLAAQDFSLAKIDLVARGYTFTEGAAWNAKDGYLVFSDTPSDRLMKWVPGHEVADFRADAHGPCGNAFDEQGRLYTCETRTRRVTRTDRNGKIEVLASEWEGKKLNAPSHVVVSRNDHVYFTDPAYGSQSDHRELDFYGVYHIPPKGPMTLVAKTTGRPNGIALSPNGKILYVSNSDDHNVRAYDVDGKGGTSNERVVISRIAAVPGGMTVDEKGNLFVAARGIHIYSPDGKQVHNFEVKEFVSSCAFAETDLKSFMVTARGNLYRARFGDPDAK